MITPGESENLVLRETENKRTFRIKKIINMCDDPNTGNAYNINNFSKPVNFCHALDFCKLSAQLTEKLFGYCQ